MLCITPAPQTALQRSEPVARGCDDRPWKEKRAGTHMRRSETVIDKVELYVDQVSSHMSKSTATYLAKKESETGIKCIPFDEILVKPFGVSPKDFCDFDLLKRALGKQQRKTLELTLENGLRRME
ncbi:hypothetical protein TNCV_2398941 [Trichonephila clavipes]|uniref:Uncharacterized protein n=1 Tax=Trichonephila clavipes TaxID=2585209 RepID=A0A8X6SVP4_TRICX|nr:hypothetical protein TNCV_2398941 [Trichonephila clavipes]